MYRQRPQTLKRWLLGRKRERGGGGGLQIRIIEYYRRGFQQAVDDSSVVAFILIVGKQSHQRLTDSAVFGYFRVVDGPFEDRCVVISVSDDDDDVEDCAESRLSSVARAHPQMMFNRFLAVWSGT